MEPGHQTEMITMAIEDTTTFEESTRGEIPKSALVHCREKLDRIGSHCREPITHVEIRLTDDPNHPGSAQTTAEASMTTTRGPIRAHAQAETVNEAIDLMIQRMKRRLDRHESRLHRIGTRRHDGVASVGSWKHGDVADAPRHPQPRSGGEPMTVVRNKSFASEPMTVDDAAYQLEILDHNFYLFHESSSDTTALLSRAENGRYALNIAEEAAIENLPVGYVDRMPGPVVLDLDGAQRVLETTSEPFVFFADTHQQPGQVLYRRHDGNLGIVGLAAATAVSKVP